MANAFLDLTGTPALIATGSNDLRIGCSGTGTTKFFSNGSPTGVLNSTGLIVGGTTTVSGITGAPIEIQAAGSSVNALKIVGYSSTAADGPYIAIGRTKGTAAATNTIVASGDMLGSVLFTGANGASYSNAAEIKVVVDGTPGASNDMPGRIELHTTPDGSGTQLRRFFVDAAGVLNQDTTNGGSIVLTKASTCVVPGTSATGLTAAGTIITDALDLTAVFNNVTTVGANSGVQLWDAPLHSMIAVRNAGANALNVWPEAAGSTINGGGAGSAVAVATGTLNLFWRTGATAWIAVEFTVAAA